MTFLASYSELVADVSSLLIILLQIVTVIIIVGLIIEKSAKKELGFLNFFRENAILLAFLIVLGAMAGSLYFSEIALYPPCKLCWIQRIFIFPQVLILGIAVFKKDYRVRIYSGALALVGISFSIYHYIVETFKIETTCDTLGSPSCTERYFLNYGYISLAMMALSVSLFVIVMMLIAKEKRLANPQEQIK